MAQPPSHNRLLLYRDTRSDGVIPVSVSPTYVYLELTANATMAIPHDKAEAWFNAIATAYKVWRDNQDQEPPALLQSPRRYLTE